MEDEISDLQELNGRWNTRFAKTEQISLQKKLSIVL